MSDQFPPPTGAPVEPVEPAAPTSGTPKVIVWAFILSLAGFLILTALAAVAMVLTNWKRVNATGKGKGLAIAALVISGFWLAIMAFAVLSPSNEPGNSAGTEVAEVIEEAPEPEAASVAEAVLRMGVTDETTTGIPEDFEVWVRGTGSWFYAQDSLIEEAGPFAVGQPVSFFIYPQGRESTEIEVSLVLPDDVIAGSVRDLITIAVSDTDVTVSGTSVPDFEATFPRLAAELVAEPTPEPEPVAPEESVGSKLALIDGEFSRSSAATYERRISQAAERCGEPEMATADKVVRATQLLDERGITESNLWVMDSILQAIPPRDAGTLDCAEVIALLVTLRINE